MFPAGPKKKLCAICRKPIEPLDDKIMIERHNGRIMSFFIYFLTNSP